MVTRDQFRGAAALENLIVRAVYQIPREAESGTMVDTSRHEGYEVREILHAQSAGARGQSPSDEGWNHELQRALWRVAGEGTGGSVGPARDSRDVDVAPGSASSPSHQDSFGARDGGPSALIGPGQNRIG